MDRQTAELMRRLQSGQAGDEQIVRKALSEMPAERAVESILAWMQYDRTQSRWGRYKAGIGSCLALLAFPFIMDSGFTVTLMFYSCALAAISWVGGNKKLRKQCCVLLAAYGDVGTIDLFVREMAHGQQDVKLSAITALTQLLPKLKPVDAPLLSRASRRALNEVLVSNVKEDFVLAILAAWEQVGDIEAIPFVEQLSNGKGAAGSNPAVREAAQYALPALQTLAARSNASDKLLRPSKAIDQSSTLLQPVPQNSSDQHTLLQAASETRASTSD